MFLIFLYRNIFYNRIHYIEQWTWCVKVIDYNKMGKIMAISKMINERTKRIKKIKIERMMN